MIIPYMKMEMVNVSLEDASVKNFKIKDPLICFQVL
jgi:hypothetical protein